MKTHSLVMAAAGAQTEKLYVDDVFSTYVYTGNTSVQPINNGIDLASKGGLVWFKSRTSSAYDHWLIDSARGTSFGITTNSSASQIALGTTYVSGFNTNGFSLGGASQINQTPMVSWTFRKDPKFFDVVTYTGTGAIIREIPHSLSSHPGFIIIKRTDSTSDWIAIARDSSGTYKELRLNTNGAAIQTYASYYLASVGTQNYFHVGTNAIIGDSNVSGATYVAYLFAHNAGGFGLSGTDNAISCGSYTGNGLTSGPVVTLGYEPQWVLVKRTDATVATGNWQIQDNMRSLSQTNTNILFSNLSNAATTGAYPSVVPTATGFYIGDNGTGYNASGGNYIYIAIRRPNKPPTIGTSVFSHMLISNTNYSTPIDVSTNFPVDFTLFGTPARLNYVNTNAYDRLRGGGAVLATMRTDAEAVYTNPFISFDSNTSINSAGWGGGANQTDIYWNFRRAPGFFDVVCYTSSGTSPQTISHNLGVVPQLIIAKQRNNSSLNWFGANSVVSGRSNLSLNSSKAFVTFSSYDASATTFNTRSLFDVDAGITGEGIGNGSNIVAYLFATVPGVSKVGSYTGNGSNQTINCGFTTGARFLLIKCANAVGDWYVWDSARGIVSANDPHLSLNTGVAEVTTDDSVDPDNSGFIVNQVAATNINVSSATYIYLAIA